MNVPVDKMEQKRDNKLTIIQTNREGCPLGINTVQLFPSKYSKSRQKKILINKGLFRLA